MAVREFSSEPQPGQEPAQPNPLKGVSFTLDGEKFECLGELDFLDRSELSALAVAGTDITSPHGLAMLSQFLHMAFGGNEYIRFKMHTRLHKTPPEILFEILKGITEEIGIFTEAQTGRPFGPPSSSSATPPDPGERISKVISLQTGDVKIVDPPPAAKPGAGKGTARTSRRRSAS